MNFGREVRINPEARSAADNADFALRAAEQGSINAFPYLLGAEQLIAYADCLGHDTSKLTTRLNALQKRYMC